MISLRGVTKTFPGTATPAVDTLDLEIPRGEIVVLVGPSGCGKTTTLKMINRVIEPTSGTIMVDGEDATAMEAHVLRRRIGYVIQQIGLFPHRTIADNIATVPRLLGWDQDRVTERVTELIDIVGLEPEMAERYPAALSGGQQQRVGVARALAADPPVLLMDEPFGAVDPIVRGRLQQELLDLQAELRKTIVFVTHDIDEAISLGDRVAILNVGGHLEQFAEPIELLREPANEFVAAFLGSDRGIKQLSLLPLNRVDLSGGPVVGSGSPIADAQRLMAELGVGWIAVLEGDRLLGWLPDQELAGADTVPAVGLRPFRSRVDVTANLREALDAVITGNTEYAAVFDHDRFVGMLSADTVSEEMRR
ncbi:MAG: ABC transporter ATP-binding protein [Acidimicrobiia bacterium]|nr:ABC transporter ATP-binding protein [Acidimicrobiia bacterium]